METKIIVLANQKGGVGKTVLSSIIATELHALYKDVCLVDCDEQGTLNLKRRYQLQEGENGSNSYDIYRANTLQKYKTFLNTSASKYKYVIVDTKGEFSDKTFDILSSADFVLTPLQATDSELMSFDLYFKSCIIRLKNEHNIKIIPILNRVTKSSSWNLFLREIPTILKEDYNITIPKMQVPLKQGSAKQYLQLSEKLSYQALDTITSIHKRKGVPKIVKSECTNFIKSLVYEFNN